VSIPPVVFVVVGYLLGSISFAVLLVRAVAGKDIRSEGSGNAGATNVLRAYGKKLALLVALLDVAKGAAAVLLVRLVTADPFWGAAAGMAARRRIEDEFSPQRYLERIRGVYGRLGVVWP